jgi:diadenosine tetraphosphate (Ap4A) HIT family hydrolase
VRWGHALVLSKQHVTSFSELSAAHWREMSEQARRAAFAVERALAPARCYVASLGTSEADVPITSPHLHLHVVPVYDPDDRPSRVLTWEHGVLEAELSEWHALAESLRAAWPEE